MMRIFYLGISVPLLRVNEHDFDTIDHSRPPFCNYLVETTVYGACFYVAKVMDEYGKIAFWRNLCYNID